MKKRFRLTALVMAVVIAVNTAVFVSHANPPEPTLVPASITAANAELSIENGRLKVAGTATVVDPVTVTIALSGEFPLGTMDNSLAMDTEIAENRQGWASYAEIFVVSGGVSYSVGNAEATEAYAKPLAAASSMADSSLISNSALINATMLQIVIPCGGDSVSYFDNIAVTGPSVTKIFDLESMATEDDVIYENQYGTATLSGSAEIDDTNGGVKWSAGNWSYGGALKVKPVSGYNGDKILLSLVSEKANGLQIQMQSKDADEWNAYTRTWGSGAGARVEEMAMTLEDGDHQYFTELQKMEGAIEFTAQFDGTSGYVTIKDIFLIGMGSKTVTLYDFEELPELPVSSDELFEIVRDYLLDNSVIIGANILEALDKTNKNEITIVDLLTIKELILSEYVEVEPSLLSLQCVTEHPGVPGYDTEYQMRAYYNGKLLSTSAYTLSSNSPLVKINGSTVVIPADVNNRLGGNIPVIATYVPDNTSQAIYRIRNYKWTQTFNDDFDGAEIDSAKWSSMPSYENSPTKWTVNPASSFVEDGKLVLLAEKRPYSFTVNGKACNADYSVGAIETYGKFSQKYGCFMASFKMEEKVGTFSSFWLMPVTRSWGSKFLWKNNTINAFCGEVDIFEHAYKWGRKVMITDHYWNANGTKAAGNSKYYTMSNMYGRFLNWACIWTETGKYIYCDGKLIDSQTDLTATGEEAFMMLDIYMGSLQGQTSDMGNWVGYFKDSDLPIRAEVDYVKAYSFR